MRNRFAIAVACIVAAGTLALAAAPTAGAADHPDIGFGVVRLSGAEEIGPTGQAGVGDADGKGTFAYVAFDSKLCYFLTARKIATPTFAHIHAAPRGVNGGIMAFLQTPASGFAAECITAEQDETLNTPMILTQSELDSIIADPAAFYANVHNAEFPAGAIRGQLK